MFGEDEQKTTKVVGLAAGPETLVPRVVLKGAGITADDVLQEAKALGRAHRIIKNEELLQQLYKLPIDAPIDADLFRLVAMLLVHVSLLDQEKEMAMQKVVEGRNVTDIGN